jgi:hypothetical protein
MNMPAHPPQTDDEAANPQRRGRTVIAAIAATSVVALLAGIHLLRAALG